VGFVLVAMPFWPTATHSVAVGHDTALSAAPGTAVAVHADAPPVGLMLTNPCVPETATYSVGLWQKIPLSDDTGSGSASRRRARRRDWPR